MLTPNAAPVSLRKPDKAALRQLRVGYFEDDGRVPVTRETRGALQKQRRLYAMMASRLSHFFPRGLMRR
jgi:hypothetical protein